MGVRGVRRKGSSPIKLNAESMLDFAAHKQLFSGNLLNIEGLIGEYSIPIEKKPLPSEMSGTLIKNGGNWVITVNSRHSDSRQRYTLAHEFAHYCLHRDDYSSFEDMAFFRKEENRTMMEYEANQFAAELLMPEKAVRAAIADNVLSLKELSKMFGVSLIAMRYRLIELGYKLVDDEE
jgi:Zn-dependent peptidase ImmA (M78 family)